MLRNGHSTHWSFEGVFERSRCLQQLAPRNDRGRKRSSQRACRIAVGQRLHRHDRLGTREGSFAILLCEIERADRHNQEHPNRGCDDI